MRIADKARPLRVVVHGLPHFCQKLRGLLRNEAWDVRYRLTDRWTSMAEHACDLSSCDLAYSWGGRVNLGKFLWAARLLGKRKLVMLWSGSDVSYARKDLLTGKIDPWIADKIHWAVSPWLAEEVRSLGLPCEYVQTSFVEPVDDPPPLPEKFSVLVYLPSLDKATLYGWNEILEVARRFPSIEFNLVGLQPKEKLQTLPNINVHGWTTNLKPFLERTTVLWRPVQHDGLSFMVLQALAYGRHVLYSYPLPSCIHVAGATNAQQELERLLDSHDSKTLSLNHEGMDLIARDFCPQRVRADILQRWEKIILSPDAATARKLAAPSIGR